MRSPSRTTPVTSGYVTGNPTADLQTQLNAILQFNQIWAQYLPTLNAARSPIQAADIYVTDFERAGLPGPQPPRSRRRGGGRRLWSVTRARSRLT